MLQAAARRNGAHLSSGNTTTAMHAMLLQCQMRSFSAVAPGLGHRRFSKATGGQQFQRQAIPLQLLQARFQSTQTGSTATSTSSKGPQGGPPPLDAYTAGKPAAAAAAFNKAGTASSASSTKASVSEKPVSATTGESSSTSKDAAISNKDKSTSSSSSGDASTSASTNKEVSKPKDPLMTRVWAKVKHEASHYWNGTKLLGKEIKISARLQMKLLKGKSLSRREKRQLKRTTQDLLRLIPFIPFVIIPFMEFLLPVALKIFPNMLPSTFEDKHAADEKKRKLLKVRLEMAKFLQETIRESGLAKSPDKIQQSEEFKAFFRKVRSTGEEPSTDDIVKVAKLFEDDLTLDNLSRPQLVSMCRYMNINAFGTDNFLRYTIRNRLAKLGNDDKLIDGEGVDALSATELAHACQSRGIRTGTASEEKQRAELEQWIELHLHRNLSGVLLILSKAFAFTEKADGTIDHLSSLKHTLSSLPDTLLNETELEMSDDKAFKERLEVLQQQEELIEDEAEQEQEEEEARRLRKEAQVKAEEAARLEAEEQEKSRAESEVEREKAKFEREKEVAKDMLPEELAAQMEPQPSSPKKDAKMTTEQLSELGDALYILSARSSVRREREDLAKLMEESQASQAENTESVTQAEDGESGEKTTKKTVSALEKRIQKMIKQIDEQLDAYDKEVSDKLTKFPVGPDGKISIESLRAAFEQIRHRPDDETITALIDKLDVDHDGFVPLDDVTSLAEVEGLGVVIDDAAADQIIGETKEIRQDEGISALRGVAEQTSKSTESKESKSKEAPKKPKREEIVE